MASQLADVASSPTTKKTTTTTFLSAVTAPSVSEETWKLTWKIKGIRHLVGAAIEKHGRRNIIAKFPFEMGASFGQQFSLEWVLKYYENGDAGDADINYVANYLDDDYEDKQTIGLVLNPIKPVGSDDAPNELWRNVFFLTSIKVMLGDEVFHEEEEFVTSETIQPDGWRWAQMVWLSELNDYLDLDGAMTLQLCLVAHYDPNDNDGDSTTFVTNGDQKLSSLKEKFLKKEPVYRVACLLGDKETSDMSICVVNEKDEEIARLPCHSAILSAQSGVFRAMLISEGMAERKNGVVRMNDVSPEVVEQFLSFLYSGRFKNKDEENEDGFLEVWIKILPQLVYMADKYVVEDLRDFCDEHFHITVNEGNAVEMYKLAKRHGLTRAQARLLDDFAKNIDLIVQPSASAH